MINTYEGRLRLLALIFMVILSCSVLLGCGAFAYGETEGADTGVTTAANKLSWWEIAVNFLKGILGDFWWVSIAVLILVVLGTLAAIFPPVWMVVKAVLKGLWLVISAPVRLVMRIVEKSKERKGK